MQHDQVEAALHDAYLSSVLQLYSRMILEFSAIYLASFPGPSLWGQR